MQTSNLQNIPPIVSWRPAVCDQARPISAIGLASLARSALQASYQAPRVQPSSFRRSSSRRLSGQPARWPVTVLWPSIEAQASVWILSRRLGLLGRDVLARFAGGRHSRTPSASPGRCQWRARTSQGCCWLRECSVAVAAYAAVDMLCQMEWRTQGPRQGRRRATSEL